MKFPRGRPLSIGVVSWRTMSCPREGRTTVEPRNLRKASDWALDGVEQSSERDKEPRNRFPAGRERWTRARMVGGELDDVNRTTQDSKTKVSCSQLI